MAKKEKQEVEVEAKEQVETDGVWTPEGTLAEQIEKQKLINEGKLKRE